MPITSVMTMDCGEQVGRFTLPGDYVSGGEKKKAPKKKRKLAEEKPRRT